MVHQVGDERRVEQALGVLPEGVARVLGVAFGVGDEALDDGEHVDVAPHVGERVVAARGVHAHQVEAPYAVASLLEHPAGRADERALGVGHEVARVHLHEQRQHVAARLSRAGRADHADVAVAVGLQVEARALDGDADVLGEGDVHGRVLAVHERAPLVERAPACGPVLLASAERAAPKPLVGPQPPDGAGAEHARQRGERARPRNPARGDPSGQAGDGRGKVERALRLSEQAPCEKEARKRRRSGDGRGF